MLLTYRERDTTIAALHLGQVGPARLSHFSFERCALATKSPPLSSLRHISNLGFWQDAESISPTHRRRKHFTSLF